MENARIRVLLKLSPEAEPEAVLAAAEQALGRPIPQVRLVRGAGVMAFPAEPSELALLRELPGVQKAEREGTVSLLPDPVKHRWKR